MNPVVATDPDARTGPSPCTRPEPDSRSVEPTSGIPEVNAYMPRIVPARVAACAAATWTWAAADAAAGGHGDADSNVLGSNGSTRKEERGRFIGRVLPGQIRAHPDPT